MTWITEVWNWLNTVVEPHEGYTRLFFLVPIVIILILFLLPILHGQPEEEKA